MRNVQGNKRERKKVMEKRRQDSYSPESSSGFFLHYPIIGLPFRALMFRFIYLRFFLFSL